MRLTSEGIIQELLTLTQKNINSAESFKLLTLDTLNFKENSDSWSILECLEHLNRYGDFYISEISNKIKQAKHPASTDFKSNWLGNYFSKSVAYNQPLNKMKTFKLMNTANSSLGIKTINKFIQQQHQLIDLLNEAKRVNLDKTKTAISISKWIKLKLGDTFRVVIYHNERHIKQAERVAKIQ